MMMTITCLGLGLTEYFGQAARRLSGSARGLQDAGEGTIPLGVVGSTK